MKLKKFLIGLLVVICLVFTGCVASPENPDTGNGDSGYVLEFETVYAMAQEAGYTGTMEDLIALFKGEKGDKGDTGATGEKGDKGDTGAGIESVEFDEQGRLVITLTDGTVLEPVDLPDLHTYGEWQVFGNDDNTCEDKTFYRVCSTCNEMQFKKGSYSDHDWEIETIEPTCQEQGYDHKVCKNCGKEEYENYQPISDHRWQEVYITDNSFHWIKCNDCEETKDVQEHVLADSGYCKICNAVAGSTIGLVYEASIDGTYAEVVGYEGTAKNIIIAEEYNGLPVKSIYNEAFKNSSITSIEIPDSVTSIGNSAFSSCSSLTSIEIPDSVTSIGNSAFSSCSSLTSIEIPDSVTSIGRGAFSYCNSALYTTENNLKYVKANNNPYCLLIEATNKNLSTYTINSQTKYIGYGVFRDCARLSSIEIPNSVTSIGEEVFYNCNSLTSIEIPDSVTSIGEGAFFSCDSLIIYCEASSKPSGWNSDWNFSSRPVYWAGEWEYVNGVPTPKN